jgi:cytochrome c
VGGPRPALPLVALIVLAACEQEEVPGRRRAFDGSPELGEALIAQYGCTACQAVPGVEAVTGTVGPPLAGFGARAYIAGRPPNRPTMLIAWLLDPPSIDSETAMPTIGLTEAEARDIATYLYTLR